MSYEPTNWKAGDTVTSAKLNKIEQGIAKSGVLVVNAIGETGTLDKTWQEIHDAGLAVLWIDGDLGIVCSIGTNAGAYEIVASVFNNQDGMWGLLTFLTDSADGYPVFMPDQPDSDPITPMQ